MSSPSPPDTTNEQRLELKTVIQRYLSESYFDGLTETVDNRPAVMNKLWLAFVVISAVIACGMAVHVVVEYANQQPAIKLELENLESFPPFATCFRTYWKEKLWQMDTFFGEVSRIEQSVACIRTGECFVQDTAMESNLTLNSANFDKVFIERVQQNAALYYNYTEILFSGLHGENVWHDPFAKDYLSPNKQLSLCRLHSTDAFETTPNIKIWSSVLLSPYYAMPSGVEFSIDLAEHQDERATFFYSTTDFRQIVIVYNLRKERLITNCSPRYSEDSESLCLSKEVYQQAGCCLCGSMTKLCPATAVCCMPYHISETLQQDVRSKCQVGKKRPQRPACERLTFGQGMVRPFEPIDINYWNSTREMLISVLLQNAVNLPVVQEYYEKQFTDMLGSFGGVFSLFVGGSITAAVHFAYFFCGHLLLLKHEHRLKKLQALSTKRQTDAQVNRPN